MEIDTKLFSTVFLLLFILFLAAPVISQTEEEAIQSLNQSMESIQEMEEDEIPVDRVKDLYQEANNTYNAQKSFADEGGEPDYSRVITLTEDILRIKEDAITANDEIEALESRLKELENESDVDFSEARSSLNASKQEFQDQRFEAAIEEVDTAYSQISEAQSAQARVRSFAAAGRENMLSWVRARAEYVRNNWIKVTVIGVLGIFFGYIGMKWISLFMMYRKVMKTQRRKDVLNRLIKRIQTDYYGRKTMSSLEYKVKLEKYEDMERDANQKLKSLISSIENKDHFIPGFDFKTYVENQITVEEEEEEE